MSDYRLEDFKTRIRTEARLDSSTATTALLLSYLNDTIKTLQVDVKFPKKVTEVDKTVGAASFADFSSTSDFDTANVISIRDEDGIGNVIQIIPKEIFDKVQPIQDSTSGYPSAAVPVSPTKYNVFPYGTDTTWKVKYYAKHFDFSADSQIMQLDDLAYATVCNAVTGKMLLWKDDNRANMYLGMYELGVKKLQKKFQPEQSDLRMQPGTQTHTNAEWERIFGDEH